MNHSLGNLAKGAQMGVGFCIAVASVLAVTTFATAAWWALPNAGTTLSSSAWNDIVSQLNTLAGALNVTSGNVGVGKASPDARLDVNGEMIRNVFYLEPGAVVNTAMAGWAWTNLGGGWNFTYTKKSATSKLLITVNATSRWNLNASSGWWQLGMYVGWTLYDFWGNYIASTDMHTPGMYRRAVSGIPKGAVSIQGAILQTNASQVCIGCTGIPNITIEEIY